MLSAAQHWDRSCRSNLLSHPVTVYWHLTNQSWNWPYNTRRLTGFFAVVVFVCLFVFLFIYFFLFYFFLKSLSWLFPKKTGLDLPVSCSRDARLTTRLPGRSVPGTRPPRWPSGKASASRAADTGFDSRLCRDFSGLSHTSDLKIGTPVATLPGAWRYRVSAGTGRLGVSKLWLGETENSICNFCLSVAARITEQISPWDSLACFWDVKQASKQASKKQTLAPPMLFKNRV